MYKKLFALCLGVFLSWGCGSAVETGSSFTAGALGGGSSGIVGTFQVTVNPLTTTINTIPNGGLGFTAFQSLGLLLDSNAVELTWSDISDYDETEKKLRLTGAGGGLCARNVSTENFSNLVASFHDFSVTNALIDEGGKVGAKEGTFDVDFGPVPSGDTACRTFAIKGSDDNSEYSFYISLNADVTPDPLPGDLTYMTDVSETIWGSHLNEVVVYGVNLSPLEKPTVFVGSFEVPSENIASFSATEITLTIDPELMYGWAGSIKLDTGTGPVVWGPYVQWPTQLQFNVALPQPEPYITTSVFARTFTEADGVDADGCVVASLADARRINDVTLSSSSFATVDMGYLSSESNTNVYLAADMNNNGILDEFDYYALFHHVDIHEGATNSPVNANTIAVGGGHACGIIQGKLYCWGYNASGQLGDGSILNKSTPTLVSNMGSGVNATDAPGIHHTCALKGSRAYCWGQNLFGQLGDGTFDQRNEPVEVANLGNGVRAISAGVWPNSCAIKGSQAYCWGDNSHGQLGNNTTDDSNVPVAVNNMDSGVQSIAVGSQQVCAIKQGKAYCWGANDYGQLGDGTVIERHEPVEVAVLGSGVSSITTGLHHTCAIKGGIVYCWGDNSSGQLGNGLKGKFITPTEVAGLGSGVHAITANNDHTCAIKGSQAFCWGENLFGQLGDNSKTIRRTPVPVIDMESGVSAISTGRANTCAIKQGKGYCWGHNLYGQLGNGTARESLTPKMISGAHTFESRDITFSEQITATCPK